MPIGNFLVLMSDVQQFCLSKIVTNDLQSDCATYTIKPDEDRHPGQASKIRGHGINVIEIHLDGIVDVFPEIKGRCRRCRSHYHVNVFKGGLKILSKQATKFLCLQIVGVVISVRKNVSSYQNASLYLGPETFGSAFFVH